MPQQASQVMDAAVPAQTVCVAAGAHAAAVVTLNAAGAGYAHGVEALAVSYGGSGTLSGGNVQVADGSDVVFNLDIPALGNFLIPLGNLAGTPNRAMTVTLADGGANVNGKVNVLGHRILAGVPVTGLDLSNADNSGLAAIL